VIESCSGYEQSYIEAEENDNDWEELFNMDTWRALRLPLQAALKDLRSQLVHEACDLVASVALSLNDEHGIPVIWACKDGGRMLMREIVPTLFELLSSGNKTSAQFVDECVQIVVKRCRYRHFISTVAEYSTRKSVHARECCADYCRELATTWGSVYFTKHEGLLYTLERVILRLLDDSASQVRVAARQAFKALETQWPQRGSELRLELDPRTVKLLGASESRQDSGVTTARKRVKKHVLSARDIDRHVAGVSSRTEKFNNKKVIVPTSSSIKGKTTTLRPGENKIDETQIKKSTLFSSTPLKKLQHKENDNPTDLIQLKPGDRVRVQRCKSGTIRFVGETSFAAGVWIGVELDAPDGKHDGTVRGHRYYQAPPLSGLFVRPIHVAKLDEQDAIAAELPLASRLACDHKRFLKRLLDELQTQLATFDTFEQTDLTRDVALDFIDKAALAPSPFRSILDHHANHLSTLLGMSLQGGGGAPSSDIPPPPP